MRALALLAALVFGSVMGCGAARAADYPNRAVSIIVGQAAGGSTDLLARLVGHGLSERWGQPAIVQNRPGANGMVAAGLVAHAPADGFTLLWIGNPHTIVLPEMAMTYDPVKSFAPITEIASSPDILMINPSTPVDSLQGFVALAKTQPHRMNFGTSGPGTLQSLAMKLFLKQAGLDLVEVPFNGGAPQLIALQGGEVQIVLGSFSGGLPMVKARMLKALAVSSGSASPKLPGVPTIAEGAGLPGFRTEEWFGAVAPAGTPDAIIGKLHDDIVAVLQLPDVQKRLDDMGFTRVGNSPAEFGRTIADDTAKWSAVLASLGSQ